MLDREGVAAVLYTQAASQNAHLVPPKYGLPLSENEGGTRGLGRHRRC